MRRGPTTRLRDVDHGHRSACRVMIFDDTARPGKATTYLRQLKAKRLPQLFLGAPLIQGGTETQRRKFQQSTKHPLSDMDDNGRWYRSVDHEVIGRRKAVNRVPDAWHLLPARLGTSSHRWREETRQRCRRLGCSERDLSTSLEPGGFETFPDTGGGGLPVAATL